MEGWECNIAGMMNEFTEILGTNESPFFSPDCQSNSPPLHTHTSVMMIYLY